MEADWEFEIGGDAPVIEAVWPGFVDLRQSPERAWQLPEAAQLPALAEALTKLNAASSPVWTSKCDLWTVVDSAEFDADELDAPHECAAHAIGCYIDLLPCCGRPRNASQWETPAMAAAACKQVCGLLRAVPLRCCRVDLIIRRAILNSNPTGLTDLGITAYLTACGPSLAEAAQAIQAALAAFARVLCADTTVQ
jgi:hypothetical protein